MLPQFLSDGIMWQCERVSLILLSQRGNIQFQRSYQCHGADCKAYMKQHLNKTLTSENEFGSVLTVRRCCPKYKKTGAGAAQERYFIVGKKNCQILTNSSKLLSRR